MQHPCLAYGQGRAGVLTCMFLWFGKLETGENPSGTQGERHTERSTPWDLNPEPSCCEAAVLHIDILYMYV